jgi:hypothetical protein
MRPSGSSLVLATLTMVFGTCLAAGPEPGGGTYNVLEVARFEVGREDYSSKEAERAGRIPDEVLETIQRILISEFTQSRLLPAVRKAGTPAGGDTVLELGGKVVDYLAGSQAKRLLIGMGAGQQKIEVDCVLRDRATGTVLGRVRILDRKVAGIAGGNEEKGMRDFAEKVAKFLRNTMEPVGWKAPAAPSPPITDPGEDPVRR